MPKAPTTAFSLPKDLRLQTSSSAVQTSAIELGARPPHALTWWIHFKISSKKCRSQWREASIWWCDAICSVKSQAAVVWTSWRWESNFPLTPERRNLSLNSYDTTAVLIYRKQDWVDLLKPTRKDWSCSPNFLTTSYTHAHMHTHPEMWLGGLCGHPFEIHAMAASTKNLWTSLNFTDLKLKVRGFGWLQ